jgi:hypothetical protein
MTTVAIQFDRLPRGVIRAMRPAFIAFAAAVVVLATIDRANAVCFDDTAHYIKHGYHTNVQWPWPYVCPDRIAVQEPFCIMINNGWRRQNMLGAHHFNAETNQLNAAGQLRVQWIMTQAPADRRSIFVERSIDPKVNALRTAAVREYSTQVALDGQFAQVTETPLISEGRPASVVDAVNVKFQQAMPAPVLPPAQGSSSSSGTSAQ